MQASAAATQQAQRSSLGNVSERTPLLHDGANQERMFQASKGKSKAADLSQSPVYKLIVRLLLVSMTIY